MRVSPLHNKPTRNKLMNTPTNVQAYEADIKLGEALARLEKNKDYKLIINDLILAGGAIKLTENLVNAKDQSKIVQQLLARSWMYKALSDIKDNHESAKYEIAGMQEPEVEVL